MYVFYACSFERARVIEFNFTKKYYFNFYETKMAFSL